MIRNPGLDTLRALAIVLVVLHHYVLFVSGESTFGAIGDVGWIGVDLFFALSGYLIGNQIFGAKRLHIGRFYARRLLRTVPNFYVVLALYAAWPWFRAGLDLPPLWRFLTFTQNIGLEPGTAFSHAWSLCIEEQFYMVLPAVALLLAPGRRSVCWSWAVIALAVAGGLLARGYQWHIQVNGSASEGNHYFRFIYYSSLCRLDELVAGVALALTRNHHPSAWRRLTAHGNLVLALGVAVLLPVCWWFLDDRMAQPVTLIGYPLLALGFGLLILSALSEDSILRRIEVPGARQLALWSFAIYLIHKQVGILGGRALGDHGIEPGSLAAIVPLMALSVLCGWLLYRCVELPFMALRERYSPAHSGVDDAKR